MPCSRCGSERSYQFEANPQASKSTVGPAVLPVVCRSCGLMTVDGKRLEVPESFEAHAKELAAAAAQAGAQAYEEMVGDGENARVSKYFAKVYRDGYLDGFLRHMAFARHNFREGKIKRLRELWGQIMPVEQRQEPIGGGTTLLLAPTDTFTEFDQLLTLGPVPD